MQISLIGRTERASIEEVTGFAGTPDSEGILGRIAVQLPPLADCSYYAAYQTYDVSDSSRDSWPETANRMQALQIADFGSLKRGGTFLVAKLEEEYLVLMPLATDRTISWFTSDLDQLTLNFGNLGTGRVEGDLPILAWARDADVYAAAAEVWRLSAQEGFVTARARSEKHYPEVFRYLGWCSWEEYRFNIDEDMLIDACAKLADSVVPVRYVLIDDGHLDERDHQLRSFETNHKFPNGWKRILATRDQDKIKWFGIWLNFNGYWDGISVENSLGLDDHLSECTVKGKAALLPRIASDASKAFYGAMVKHATDAGFDFLKVDNQAANLEKYMGSDQPVEAALHNSQSLEAACQAQTRGLINCMAHNTACAASTKFSAITRCSEDYLCGSLEYARRHIHNSFANIIWLGHTVWGDHDMFHSNDKISGRMMAVSKALSGGPVYLSDAPDALVPANILPLCYEDGELLRPLAPASPLPGSLFINPFKEAKPFEVIAPLSNGTAAFATYNLTEPAVPVSGTITTATYEQAGVMTQPRMDWEGPDEGLLVYDWYEASASPLGAGMEYTIEVFADRLYLLCPIHSGWAVVGRQDKYLSATAVNQIEATSHCLALTLAESGPIIIWSAQGPVTAEGRRVMTCGKDLYRIELPVGERNVTLQIKREA